MELEKNFTEKKISDYSLAVFNYLYNNNKKRSIKNGGQITFNERNVKVIKNSELEASFTSNITIRSDIPSQRFIVYIDNSDEIQPLAGKETFWPTKYKITYENGILIIENNEIKIIVT